MKISLLPGDGIGPEIVKEAVRLLDALRSDGLKIETEEGPVGGAAYDAAGDPLPPATLALATGVGLNTFYIEKGVKSLEELLCDLGKGLFITELLGVHTINTVSGDFSLGAAGFWVEGGKAAYPVRGMAIAGNLLGLLSNIGACASDLRFIGSIGAPSLLVNEIEASGT